ncbi:hypothetical protein BDQ12DRAFT_697703 [Crucibulum laeve]|uniref:HTH APSES-type domain-containing protein n=1 Tax=Crucibulum laeve TaxID=68775 RepID=A0A5C3M4J7_9AGAR|nr:hypothetical protein BDQ12DRAFT_697703 [Crucibulum laeve]
MTARPSLPIRHANPHVQATLNAGVLPPVKYQILNCQGNDILVGRLKIETPTSSGHAFILRRFDTHAVSLTTMFRAAFPNAPEPDEKAEVQWVKEHYDLSGNNGSAKDPHITRLAGVWVGKDVALELGKYYGLGALINVVVEATPDPKANYRRSGKAAAAPISTVAPVPQAATKSLPTPSPTNAGPGPAKRRKESSPAPAPASVPAPAARAASPSKVPAPRRSARTKSPAPIPRSAALPSISSIINKTPSPSKPARVTSPSKPRSKREEVVDTPGGSDKTVVEEESELVEDHVQSELHQEDIRDQKEMIAKLKAEREAARKLVAEEQILDQGMVDTEGLLEESSSTGTKRTREEEEETLKFNFKEPEVGERAIATNNRVGRFTLEPKTKSVAWGVAAFAIGMGAISFLPNFF